MGYSETPTTKETIMITEDKAVLAVYAVYAGLAVRKSMQNRKAHKKILQEQEENLEHLHSSIKDLRARLNLQNCFETFKVNPSGVVVII